LPSSIARIYVRGEKKKKEIGYLLFSQIPNNLYLGLSVSRIRPTFEEEGGREGEEGGEKKRRLGC